MKRKQWIIIFVGFCFVLSLAFTSMPSAASAASQGETITIKFAHQNPPKGRTTVKIIDAFINKVMEATHGKVKIVTYPAQSLIKAQEMITGIENGIADMSWTPLGYFTGRFPLTTVTMLPFMTLKDAEKNSALLQTLYDTLPEVQREYRSMKVLFFHMSDGYHLATSKKRVRNMADLKGLKIRIMGAYPIKAAKLLGVSPLFMPMPGVYEAGEKGVLDGAALPWAATATFNLQEVFPIWTDIDLWAAPFMIFMNKDKWNSLPKDVQEEIASISGMKAARWAGDAGFGPEVYAEVVAKSKKEGIKLEKITLDPGQKEKWMKIAGEPVWDDWVKEMNKKGLPGQKVLDTAKRLLKQYE